MKPTVWPYRRIAVTFAAATVALSGACNSGVKPTATIQLADSADQTLLAMTHYVTVNGVQRARVRADTAYFFNTMQQAELRIVHVTFYDVTGRETSTMTAREGTFHWRTGDMEGRGNVVVVRNSDGGTLRSEVIRYNQTRNQVSSDRDFTFDSPTQHLRGTGFTSDPDFKNIQANRITGTGGRFVLPKQ